MVISWALFIFIFFILSENNAKLENSLDDIQTKVGGLNETANILWEERVFEREMRTNLDYYLPEGFSSQVKYRGLTPLDLELGKARVYFMHRRQNYSVDFSYYYNGERLKVNRESSVDLLQ